MDIDTQEIDDEPQYTDEQVAEEVQRYRNIVLSACASLGKLEPVVTTVREGRFGGSERPVHRVEGTNMEYVPSDDCLATLKDIKRYIQMDEQGEGKVVLEWLGELEVLKRDIIPIFILSVRRLTAVAPRNSKQSDENSKQSDEDGGQSNGQWQLDTDEDRSHILKIVMMCVELFVFMTWSMATESEEAQSRFTGILRAYKRAFARADVVACLLSIAVMHVRKAQTTDMEAMLIKGVLYVFRNILAIPDPLISPTSKGIAQVESHDTLLTVLEKELGMDFFLALFSAADQRRFKDLRPILLDIIYYIFFRVPASALFSQKQAWFGDENDQENDNSPGKTRTSTRHTNFSSIYAVSTGQGTIMPVFNAREALQPFANLFKKQAKVQKPRSEPQGPVDYQWRSADPDVIPILRRVAAVFIESCFNPFFGAMFDDYRTITTAVNEAIPRMLHMAAYFVDISLANPAIELGCTCTAVQTQTFGQVMRLASTYAELKEWMYLEPAMYCIQQILLSLSRMRGTKLETLSDNVLSNLFYDGDALSLFVALCRVFRPTKASHRFQEQVARLVDTFLSTLRAYAESRSGIAGAGSGSDEEMSEEDEATEEVLVERAFEFARFETAFATKDVVKSFTLLLTPPTAMEYVYPMLYRIAVTCKRPELFFKRDTMLRLLIVFDDARKFPHRTEMVDLASWIFRQYMTVIRSPALRNHFKAEELGNPLATECMISFLRTSRMGTAPEPVITRHVVSVLASGDQDDTKATDDKDSLFGDAKETSNDTAAPAPPLNDVLEDMDDFDLGQFLNS
ncbi:Topoisomerase 1-associated factor 1 [Coemansia sp. RSA 552]|nr:Topoisomerase 1-associated factor 1 [Coemansia sp. RSA 552]